MRFVWKILDTNQINSLNAAQNTFSNGLSSIASAYSQYHFVEKKMHIFKKYWTS